MIDPSDFIAPDISDPLHNRTVGTDYPHPLAGDMISYRLVELQCSPIQGGFDTAHLQNIHHYLHQDLYDWAGELRSVDLHNLPVSDLERSVDRILDRLASENHLRGLRPEDWSDRTGDYLFELGALEPFRTGTGVTLREFATELARKNQLSLQWDRLPSVDVADSLRLHQQQAQSANLRRMIMLAMDRHPSLSRPSRGDSHELRLERLLPFAGSLL